MFEIHPLSDLKGQSPSTHDRDSTGPPPGAGVFWETLTSNHQNIFFSFTELKSLKKIF